MLDELNQVLKQVVEIVNFIKTRPLKSRLFEKMCVNMNSQHKHLTLHTKARWLSRGKVRCRVHELPGPMRGGSSRYIVPGPESQGGAHDSS